MTTHPEPTPASLGPAQAALTRAVEHLAVWRHGSGAKRVTAGHDAITAIDATLRALHAARETLVGEIRSDQDERASTVDALLAAIRDDRDAQAARVDAMVAEKPALAVPDQAARTFEPFAARSPVADGERSPIVTQAVEYVRRHAPATQEEARKVLVHWTLWERLSGPEVEQVLAHFGGQR